MIIKEIAEVKNQLSQLNLFWLDEQRRIIEQLKEEILAFNKEKDAKNVQKGKLESRIHQLEYEILPEKYQRYEAIEDVLNEEFTKEYRETIGVPRYRQELVRLKKQMSSARTLATVWRRAQRRWTGLRRNCLQHAENMQNGSNPVHSRSR